MEEREPIIRLSENETQICADCPGCSISQILRVKVRDGSLAISQAYEFDRSVPLSSTSLPQVVDALYEGIIVARSYASLSGERDAEDFLPEGPPKDSTWGITRQWVARSSL